MDEDCRVARTWRLRLGGQVRESKEMADAFLAKEIPEAGETLMLGNNSLFQIRIESVSSSNFWLSALFPEGLFLSLGPR